MGQTVEEILAENKAKAGASAGAGAADDKGAGAADDKSAGAVDDKGAGAADDKSAGAADDKGAGAADDKGAGAAEFTPIDLNAVVGQPEPDVDEPILKRAKEDPKFKGKLVDILKDDLPVQSAIADPDLYRLDVLKKTNPDAYALHSKNLFSGVSDMDLVVRDFIKDNPNFAGKESEAETFIKAKYGLDIDIPEKLDAEDPDNSPRDIKNNEQAIADATRRLNWNQQNFQLEANKSREALKTSFSAIELPKTDPGVSFEEKRTKFIGDWTEPFNQLVKEEQVFKVNFKSSGAETSVPFMDYNVPLKDFQQYAKEAVNFAFENSLDTSPESKEAVRMFIRTRVLLEKGDELFHSIGEKARSMNNEQWEKEVNNPSGIDRSRKPGASGATDKYQEFLSKVGGKKQ